VCSCWILVKKTTWCNYLADAWKRARHVEVGRGKAVVLLGDGNSTAETLGAQEFLCSRCASAEDF
jgi:hypothetical protein